MEERCWCGGIIRNESSGKGWFEVCENWTPDSDHACHWNEGNEEEDENDKS